eukprot:CAMPEP_0198500690 /NCGR_PEP_ID=MMETSP1462-20131121/8293_1 /TAXON_ID=1333877 /ORGANISM="Brandtodinium nutriculum, Strain RCC3387" /LENGTH=195 /DNA_ID=CAMNT_0044229705 /DNA_START=102 /DNA_END=685 /DNA_ORIENTATION=+
MTTAMNNGAAGSQQTPQMFWYVTAMPPGGQGNHYPGQGQEGMPQGQFDGSQQVQGFAGVPPSGGYGYGEQDASNMGGMPAMGQMQQGMMAPGGQAGNGQMVAPGAMLLVNTMMGPQGASQAPGGAVEPPAESGQASQWPQGGHDQAPSSGQPAVTRTPTQGSKAFKIVDPSTNEEIKPGKEGANPQGGPAPGADG